MRTLFLFPIMCQTIIPRCPFMTGRPSFLLCGPDGLWRCGGGNGAADIPEENPGRNGAGGPGPAAGFSGGTSGGEPEGRRKTWARSRGPDHIFSSGPEKERGAYLKQCGAVTDLDWLRGRSLWRMERGSRRRMWWSWSWLVYNYHWQI